MPCLSSAAKVSKVLLPAVVGTLGLLIVDLYKSMCLCSYCMLVGLCPHAILPDTTSSNFFDSGYGAISCSLIDCYPLRSFHNKDSKSWTVKNVFVNSETHL